jgi:hypothetical protein
LELDGGIPRRNRTQRTADTLPCDPDEESSRRLNVSKLGTNTTLSTRRWQIKLFHFYSNNLFHLQKTRLDCGLPPPLKTAIERGKDETWELHWL